MDIRRFRLEDAAEVTGCIVELQTCERTIDERVLPGEAVEDWYLDYLLKTCAEQDGTLFIAEDGGQVVGFAAVQSRVPNEDVDESDYHFALISELGVNESHRGQGIGRALIEACGAFARGRDARWLRIGVLGRNEVARGLYERCGFEDRQVLLEKPLPET
jgi:ribosomal protein S18 acetylase RimI-like enzyme